VYIGGLVNGVSRERVIAEARDTRQAMPFVQPVDVTEAL
jgi:hypothetical protein